MSKKTLYIAYDGPALASHEMDVRELAPALLALSDMFDAANDVLNGDRAKISLNVKGSFKTGSFGFDLSVAQDIFQSLVNLGNKTEVQSAATIATLLGFSVIGTVKGVLQVLKWIKNRKIDRIEIQDAIANIYIGDDFIKIEENVLRLLKNERIRRAMQDAITKPLEREGIESFGVTDDIESKNIETVFKTDAAFFIAPKPATENLGSTEYETTLQILGITFQDKNKWRFSDGISNTFYADMLDTKFLARIDNHSILFGKGDIIRAKVREVKTLDSTGTMRAERAIVHVIEHRNATPQLKLIDDDR